MHLPTRRRNRRKLVLILLLSVLSLLLVLNFGAAWYLSGVLKDRALEVREYKLEYNLTASAFGQDLVRLENGPDHGAWRRPGKWGLSWDGGSGMIGDIVEDGGNFLLRQFTIGDGDPPSSTPAFVSGSIYPNDPFLAFGIEYKKVQYETPLGTQDAWRFEGEHDTWAIFVHGHRGTPGDGLPSLPVLHDLGFPALFITYRNDKGQPQDPSGFYQFGLTEWQDLHAAVEYVLSQPGARNVVLIGHSMGGSIITKFLYESPLAGSVTGVVFDSPMMDFKAPVDRGARKYHLPGFLTATVKWITTLRFDLDWDAMDYLQNADRLDVPILLIHGKNDTYVPIETSNKLAELRPDLVTFNVYPNATHTNSWNVDSARYERELREFLLRVIK